MPSLQSSTQDNNTATELLLVIRDLVNDVHPHRYSANLIDIDSRFEKDLNLDSLTRVELISRVEKHFNLALPERIYAEADTARDLLRAIRSYETPATYLHPRNLVAPLEEDEIRSTPDGLLTLTDVLNWHVTAHPNRTHIQFYTDDGDGDDITFLQLKNTAIQVADGLIHRGLEPGEPVAIMLPTSSDYFYCFFGILFAGGIPVPIYPPARPSQLEDHIHRHVGILKNCLAKTFITVSEARGVAALLKSQVPNLQYIVSPAELISATIQPSLPVISANDTAFIQYTSGSTGSPKGVVLTHFNILANIRTMGNVVNVTSKDVFVSWLPLYHDMGLIAAWLGSLYFAALFVVMPPLSFLAKPERWLWAIHHYQGTLSASPNFGYEYCIRRLKDKDLIGLNLNSWRAAFNGAESVSSETIINFSRRYKTYGFNDKAIMPVYGLAESTVGLAFPPLNRGPVIDYIDRNTFMLKGIAKQADNDAQALKFVSNGRPLPQHQIRVIDTAGHELPERYEGKLEFKGPSSTSGYYRDIDKTNRLFDEDWLDTGDLGYIANGELYVTGRIKDIIIKAGRNIYPQELEEAVGNLSGIRTGRVAVFGSKDERTTTEKLIVVAESYSKDSKVLEKLRTGINELTVDLTGTPADEVVLAPPGSVLKTSSGKIRRAASRELYEKGIINKHKPSTYWQIAHIAFSSISPQLYRIRRYIKRALYASYCWFIYTVLASIVWVAAMLLPVFALRWTIAKHCARLFALATATNITVNGLENFPTDAKPYVLVSNHTSYLDSYALLAIVPGYPRFIAKSELAKNFYNRIPLKNIHTEFIDRDDVGKSVEYTRHLVKVLKAGNSLIFFAEGTFTRSPGLRPFHLGAFTVAANAKVPVIPVAIRGTRSILRSDSWFPNHGSIHIDIGKPISKINKNGNNTWHTAIELRERSREYILRHCGEPDLIEDNNVYIQ